MRRWRNWKTLQIWNLVVAPLPDQPGAGSNPARRTLTYILRRFGRLWFPHREALAAGLLDRHQCAVLIVQLADVISEIELA